MVQRLVLQVAPVKLVRLPIAQGLLHSVMRHLTNVLNVLLILIVRTGMHVTELRRAMHQASVLLVPLLTAMMGWLVP